MTLALIIALLALLALGSLYRMVHGRTRALRQLDDIDRALEAVDIEAFMMLVDGDEREFLRESLTARDFRRVQRQRARAALDYVGRIGRNATLLLRLGESARDDSNASIAHAGADLAEVAMRVRLNALAVTARLWLLFAFPAATQHYGYVLFHYRSLTDAAHHLTRLRQSAVAAS